MRFALDILARLNRLGRIAPQFQMRLMSTYSIKSISGSGSGYHILMFPSFMDFVALAGSLALLTALYVCNRPSRSSLNCIPGPECHSFIFGL